MKLARNKEVVFVGLSTFSCFVFETTKIISVKLGTEDYIKSFRVILVTVLFCQMSALYTELETYWIELAGY